MVMVFPLGMTVAAVNTMETALSIALFATLSAAANVREVPMVIRPPSAVEAAPAET
jgi:hypothetical protein